MDIDGYPLNLNYQSGVGMDDEASWVGLGWNVNVGSITRQLRGLPDDYSGDLVETEHFTKPKITVGGKLTGKIEITGKGSKLGSGSLSIGIFNDNYTGIGAELGLNAGTSFSLANGGALTAGLGVGVLSSTTNGADFSPSISLSLSQNAIKKMTSSAGGSASLGYNSRSGMKNLTLSQSVGAATNTINRVVNSEVSRNLFSGSSISYNTEPISLSADVPYKSSYSSFSFDIGTAATLLFTGGGGTGYKSVREVKTRLVKNPGFGFMYAERGKNEKAALMDFIRENENPIIPELPNLAIPVHLPDLFSYTSQNSSGQFRLYRGGTGVFFDNEVADESTVSTKGFDAGLGAYAHGGVTLFDQTTATVTRKWKRDNQYLPKGDFQSRSFSNPDREHVYFRQVGEKSVEDKNSSNQIHGDSLLVVNINNKTANPSFRRSKYQTSSSVQISSEIHKNSRQIKRTVISSLTASEASKAALDKNIKNFPFNELSSFTPPPNHLSIANGSETRVSAYRKAHHLSEIAVNDDSGNRMIYGVPVYNTKHEELTFAVGDIYEKKDSNQVVVDYSGNNINYKKGIDHYYHKETKPAYATSFLLTSVLSPDYMDKTDDGVTDDDLGTAITFNYSKLPYQFRWRTPYDNATLNKCLLADPDDDKASIIYGEKEIRYLHTIESKTKIAYFLTEDRQDGLGVKDWKGGVDKLNKQKCLREIRLYSKADLSKPIKVVKFDYDYELCGGLPNVDSLKTPNGQSGKLTLKRVYFQYANTKKGANHPYVFHYNNSVDGKEVKYTLVATDRWGVYKRANTQLISLTNEEFPYSNQSNKSIVDQSAALWNLQEIELPTGGKIDVTYEADDYAFVQNKRAMVMEGRIALINKNNQVVNSLKDARGLKIYIGENAPATQQPTSWFKKTYLNGSEYLYSKLFVKISTNNSKPKGAHMDFLSSYNKVKSVTTANGYAYVLFEDINEANVQMNPMIHSAWQKMKIEYPRYAFPGFDRRVKDGDAAKAIESAIVAVINAARNMSELLENFYQKAQRKNYASEVQLEKSFVRLVKSDGKKFGGGSRVAKIKISDNWQVMTDENSIPGVYGQSYSYSTIIDGKEISSGVASYEPSIGNDENPFKQPVPYVQKIKGSINNFFSLEEPFGESFFPSASVGYSKVTIRNLDKSGNPDVIDRSGYTVNEFYTAQDYPVRTAIVNQEPSRYQPKNKFSVFGSSIVDELTMSQGYVIELNDMHGKPSAIRQYNQSGSEISSVEYEYHDEKTGAIERKLVNEVDVIDGDGTVHEKQMMGRDIEFFTDFREQESINQGQAISLGFDLIPGVFALPLPIPHFPKSNNSEYKLFRSVSAVKTVQNYGILKSIIKTENGSSIKTTNVAFDGLTGEPLVTKTNNEFNNDIYSVNLPAYWIYKGMSGSYQNLGMILSGLTLNQSGFISGNYAAFLNSGDELIDLSNGNRYWVTGNEDIAGNHQKYLIDQNGNLFTGTILLSKIARSGLRNLLNASSSSFVTLSNPLVNGQLRLASSDNLTDLKVLTASLTLYDDEWSVSNIKNKTARTENTSKPFDFIKAGFNEHPGENGTVVYNTQNQTFSPVNNNAFLNNGLSRSGIWINDGIPNSVAEWLGFEYSVEVSQSGMYHIGYSGDDSLRVNIDNINLPVTNPTLTQWHLYPIYLTAGTHLLKAEGYNHNLGAQNTLQENPAAIGIEIYKNTLSELTSANSSGSGVNSVFSTLSIKDRADLQSFRTVNGNKVYHFTDQNYLNPFLYGFKGNWMPYENKVFQQNRVHQLTFDAGKKGMNLKNAGHIFNFYSYWYFPTGAVTDKKWAVNASNTERWISSKKVTLYDRYGHELENVDALGRYSAAKFDFIGELPGAVVSNAMNREIYANGFEDTKFRSQSIYEADTIGMKDFIHTPTRKKLSSYTNRGESHTGNYSVLLPTEGIELKSFTHAKAHKTQQYLSKNGKNEYSAKMDTGLYPGGFEPKPLKRYVLSAWVKDGQRNSTSVNINLRLNSATIPLTFKAIVEGWKLVEGVIDFSQLGSLPASFSLSIVPNASGTYLDDLRIYPFDAHLKSYAYDDVSMKLMAELDENGFAAFYEYDDEGNLIRVKKETERGIMTIKETRSSYVKKSL